MKSNVTSDFKFVVAVAINCSNEPQWTENVEPHQAAAHISNILQLLFEDSGITTKVEPLAYPACSKIPLIITLNDVEQRLLWFYPQMPTSELAEELAGLLSDVYECALSVSA